MVIEKTNVLLLKQQRGKGSKNPIEGRKELGKKSTHVESAVWGGKNKYKVTIVKV